MIVAIAALAAAADGAQLDAQVPAEMSRDSCRRCPTDGASDNLVVCVQ